ncbi:MAG: hypothetical protein ABFD82_08950 [Syntrophaceae bacterium]
MRVCTKSKTDKARIGSQIVIIVFGVIVFFALLASPIAAYASPPKEVTLVYNAAGQTLEVTIVHETPAPTWHYINKVEIKKNGSSVSVNDYTSQPDKSKFVYTYTVQAAKGDVLEVTASCNIYGSKTAKLTVDK